VKAERNIERAESWRSISNVNGERQWQLNGGRKYGVTLNGVMKNSGTSADERKSAGNRNGERKCES